MKNKPSLLFLAGVLSLLIAGCASRQANNDSYEFALLGDNPYSTATYDKYLRLIDHVNAQPQLRWAIHLGDVKGGGSSCSDQEFTRLYQLNQRFQTAFMVTPGDNDWLDCKRVGAGGYDEYERLSAFRRIFYPNPGYSGGLNPVSINQQSQQMEFADFVENAMWDHRGVVYATVHVVALTVSATDSAERDKRVAAAVSWIETAFAQAKASDAKGVFLAMQADPWMVFGLPGLLRAACESCAAPRNSLQWLYPLLIKESLAFGKPVVLAVGDTHIFRVDKPLYTEAGALVENFTRVESFGNPLVHWVNVKVEPNSPWVFSFREQLVD